MAETDSNASTQSTDVDRRNSDTIRERCSTLSSGKGAARLSGSPRHAVLPVVSLAMSAYAGMQSGQRFSA